MRTNFKKLTKLNFISKRRSVSSTKNDSHLPTTTINHKDEPEIELTIRQTIKKQLVDNILLILTVISVLFGIGLGFLLRFYTNLSVPEKSYFGFPGEVFLRILKFLILPYLYLYF